MTTGGDRKAIRPTPLRPSRACPICGRRANRDSYPFCSRRCADLDLSKWLSGSYAIPAPEDEAEEKQGDQD